MNYGFIGCGNMAGAIIQGCLAKNYMVPEQIWICEKDPALLEKRIRDWGVQGSRSYEECTAFADIVFLAVKPNVFPELLPEILPLLRQYNRVAVSVAAGQNLAAISSEIPVIRVMPNLNVAVGEGMAAVCANAAASVQQKQSILDLFNAVGTAIELEERLFDVFGAVAGCGPAFVYLFIDNLSRGAVKMGMSKAQALKIAAQTVLGSAKNVLSQDAHPWALIDQVCSPGGTTIEGICSLQSNGFESAVVTAVEACVKKTSRLVTG